MLTMADKIELTQLIAEELSLKVEFIQEYHLRISGNGKRLDYFPKSGRAIWVSSGKWFEIEYIDIF